MLELPNNKRNTTLPVVLETVDNIWGSPDNVHTLAKDKDNPECNVLVDDTFSNFITVGNDTVLGDEGNYQ